jgi:hypothetical protein
MAEHEGPPDPLSGPQRKAIAALLEGLTIPQAAKRAGVSRSAVWRWSQEATFATELRKAEQYQLSEISRALAAVGVSSVATLVDLKDNPEVPAMVRARAASDLLAKLIPLKELVTLEDRMAALEAALEGR